MRRGLEEHRKVFGEDFDVARKMKRAVFSDHKNVIKITFPPDESDVRAGDTIKRCATDEEFEVVTAKPRAVAGVIVSFEAVVVPK